MNLCLLLSLTDNGITFDAMLSHLTLNVHAINEAPVADFEADKTTPEWNETVTFNNLSSINLIILSGVSVVLLMILQVVQTSILRVLRLSLIALVVLTCN